MTQNIRVMNEGESPMAVTAAQFTTGMTMGSWSGVSGSIYFEEVSPNRYSAAGNAKQNVKGGQMIALDLFGEAKSKVRKVLEEMRRLAK